MKLCSKIWIENTTKTKSPNAKIQSPNAKRKSKNKIDRKIEELFYNKRKSLLL